ncbi:hypothetical protein Kpol_1062p48 [Vanderwaltozyma polyspora DSM 70294]|uniref:Actin interacting protein 3 C-terminal domain-containing protein n=1 Tax=Vanderwaltozyma polyspora (strain ATCC 22028 / DSM 70294 / BCRC 21397 / CBS 2163 / NBRC 10782 / NRRL Y-8283 / UCD 57-17) TaxID=436907 RepID=A7TKA3_VANPO|nr:uncharacterized protein Kpol_1062p48 [Vanderwaltozyma polyspora DSM 70294]EDO17338.1 hypothetical protein Kpol_1062p48 [Vanderwaltozyma polyspora DSM 70294]
MQSSSDESVRNSSSSLGSSSGLKSPVANNASVESTVTKLLISTKHLLQTLTQWSKGVTSEKTVSDAYVQLGNNLKVVSKFFKHLGVDVSDLTDLPRSLRKVLESALREPPAEVTLNKYLPTIREIIVTLLDKLKVKQAELKNIKQENYQIQSHSRNASHSSLNSSQTHRKTESVVSNTSINSSTSIATNSRTPSIFTNKNNSSNDSKDEGTPVSQIYGTIYADSKKTERLSEDIDIHRRSKSLNNEDCSNENEKENEIEREKINENEIENEKVNQNVNKNENEIENVNENENENENEHYINRDSNTGDESENDVLLQLRNSTNLQRRASKRFSAYQIAKLTSQSATDAGSPIPHSTYMTATDEYQAGNNKDQPFSTASQVQADSNVTTAGSENSTPKQGFLFLRVGDKTKKCYTPLPSNINELRLLFVKEFAYSPKKDVFPDIYIKDTKFSEYFELDSHNFNEISEGSVLELRSVNNNLSKIDLTEVTKIIKMEISKSTQSLLNELQSLPLTAPQSEPSSDLGHNKSGNGVDKKGLQDFKRDLSILKQIKRDESKYYQDTISSLLEKINKFKSSTFDINNSSDRSYMEKSQTKLGDISDSLLTRVDDLQDVIEVLRKDVADRGVKPTRKRLDVVFKQLKSAEDDLSKMQSFIATEKPTWKKSWESELDKVCEEQQFLTLQEDLTFDLSEDLAKASETYDLVKLCCEEQEKNPKKIRNNPILPIPKPGTMNQVRDQLLVEVQSLNPNHEGRVDALEKAQKLWQIEREYRDTDEFEDELGSFVEKSNFKKSGGIEEIERLRREKDEENLRTTFGAF